MGTEAQPRVRVLISAFACEPGRGSEQEVGWRWALEMARWYDITVVTQTRNRPGIERELANGIPDDRTLEFLYCELPRPLYLLKRKFDLLTWPYYAVWQLAAVRLVRKVHLAKPFSLAHHVTFVSFRVPVWLKWLGIPVVFGPVGGAEMAPAKLLRRGFPPLIRVKEMVRNLATGGCARLLRMWPPILPGRGICLAATPGMDRIFKANGLSSRVFPAIGIDAADKVGLGPDHRGEGLRFLYVGRLHPLKGTHMLLEAFARAGIPGASLTLIGGGGEARRLKELADRLKIADHLRWEGPLARADLPRHYAMHDVFVAPSLYESGGLTALEAMQQGVPVIVLDVGGHSVSVSDGCGLKVSPDGTVDEVIDRIAAAMVRYADHPGLLADHGRAAQKRVAEEYEWGRKAGRMHEIYELARNCRSL